jgi:CRISPR/Cas system-associated protein endoribonuclease Cas2
MAVEREVENEKYSFRCFLLKLGFIGDGYKVARKILLSRLEGNSAWREIKSHIPKGDETV